MNRNALPSGLIALVAITFFLASAAFGRLIDPPWLQASTAGKRPVASGQCKFGSVSQLVEIYDQVRPGKADPFTVTVRNGKAVSLKAGDLLQIFPENRTAVMTCYGHPVQVNGAWYIVSIPPNSKAPKASPFNGPTGKIVIRHPAWSATFVGLKYILTLSGGMEPITVPCDTYTVTAYAEGIQTKGGMALLQCNVPYFSRSASYPVTGPTVSITAKKTVALAIGSPVIARVKINNSSYRQFLFEFETTDAAGGSVNLRIPGSSPKAPGVTIMNAEGRKVTSFTLEYG
ncbi:MAG: hypothetical protein ACYC7E_14415 [Armatimonadota bacterium]